MSTVVRINPGAQTQHINSNNLNLNSNSEELYGRVFHIVKNDKDYGYSDWSSIGKIYYVPWNQPTPKKSEINNALLFKFVSFNTITLPFEGVTI